MKHFLCLLVFFLGLSGCATHNIHSTRIDKNKPLAQGQGVVAVQVINNTARLAKFHTGWTEVLAFRTDNIEQVKQLALEKAKKKNKNATLDSIKWRPDMYSLTPVGQGVIDSQLFVGNMPQGSYVISSLYSFFSNGDMSSWLSMPVYFSAGKFKVETGKVTDLGSIVFQPLLSIKKPGFWSNRSSAKAYVTRINKELNLSEFVFEQYPVMANQLDKNTTLTWEQDKLDPLRNDLGDLSRKNAYGAKELVLRHHGVGAVAAKFGQIRVLSQDGDWSQIDLPTNSQMASILETREKGILIAGERGQVFFNTSLRRDNWTPLQPVTSDEAVIWMGKGKNAYFAVTTSKLATKVYEFASIRGEWKQIGDFKQKQRSTFWVQNGGLFPIITQESNLRIINDNKIYDYHSNDKRWSQHKGESIARLVQLEQGTLIGLEVSQWDGVGDQVVSFDDGNTWVDIPRKLQIFGDRKSEHSLPALLKDGTLVTVGRVKERKKSKLRLISTDSHQLSKKTEWKSHGQIKESCVTMLPNLTREHTLYFLCDQGQIVSTSDFGKSWNTEVDIDLGKMQQKYEALLEAIKKEDNKDF